MPTRRFFSFVMIATACMLLFSGVSTTVQASEREGLERAADLVDAVATKGLRDILQTDLPQTEKIDRFRTVLGTYFDLESVARFVLGRYWRTASTEEQKAFVPLFEDTNVYSWARYFKNYDGQKIKISGTVPDGSKGAYVMTVVEQKNGKPLVVRWRLRKREGTPFGFQIVDLEVENISMALTYRQEYASVMQNHGGSVAALNTILRQKLEGLKAEQTQ